MKQAIVKKVFCRHLQFRKKSVSSIRNRLVSIFLCMLCVFTGYAQNKKITLNCVNEKIKTVFHEIKQQTNFSFVYNNNELNENERITVKVKNKPLSECMNIVLRNKPLSYEVRNRTIVIFKQPSEVAKKQRNEQTHKKINGRVVDDKGDVIPGALIREKSAQNNATVTDENGLYQMTVAAKSQIVCSFMGYKPVEVNIGSMDIYDIILQEEVSELDELVVTGYGQQRRISSVGSQSTLQKQDLKVPTGSLSTVLAGRLSGVVAVQRTGEPGRDAADI